MVHALVRIATSAAYAGLDLDFENMALDKHHEAAPADQIAALYPRLVSQTCAALHAVHRLCELTVMPRTSSAHVYWHGELATWVYDYAALAKAADRVQVMAYDQHDPVGGAGPVAGLDWVKRSLAYALAQMPADRTELGIPAYGYDWTGPKHATTLTAVQAAALARQQHAHVAYHPASDEATFAYTLDGRRHTVWFEDATTDLDRAKLATADGLAGIAIWAAGDEQPTLWKLLRGAR
jgi:spore germination protein YaaH